MTPELEAVYRQLIEGAVDEYERLVPERGEFEPLEEESRFHVYKAIDELAIASYHARRGSEFDRELMIENLHDSINHMAMAVLCFENDRDGCHPAMAEE